MTHGLTASWYVSSRRLAGHNYLTNGGKDMSGIIQLAEALKTNEGLTSLKYARACPKLVLSNRRQQPLSVIAFCSSLERVH